MLADGSVIGTGTLDEVARIEHPFVANFFRSRPGQAQLRKLPAYAGR